MKESYKVRPSQSPWPRVMRCVGNWRDEAFTEVDRQKLCGMAFLAEPFTQSDGEMSFAQAGFTYDQKILQVVEKAQLRELFDLGLGQILVEG